jgi:hypothetical protein
VARVRVKLNSRGMRDLLNSSGTRAALHEAGAPILARLKATALVDSGAYRDSLRMEDDTTDRAVVRIGSSLPYAGAVQANTGHLARGL